DRARFARDEPPVAAQAAKVPNVHPALPMATQLAVRGVKPNRATAILTRGQQTALARASADVQAGDAPVFDQHRPGVLCSDPEISLAILKQADDLAAGQSRRIALIKHGESHAIKTRQTVQ